MLAFPKIPGFLICKKNSMALKVAKGFLTSKTINKNSGHCKEKASISFHFFKIYGVGFWGLMYIFNLPYT